MQAENSILLFTRNHIKVLRLPLGTSSPVLALFLSRNMTLLGEVNLMSLRASNCATKRGPELDKVQLLYDEYNW